MCEVERYCTATEWFQLIHERLTSASLIFSVSRCIGQSLDTCPVFQVIRKINLISVPKHRKQNFSCRILNCVLFGLGRSDMTIFRTPPFFLLDRSDAHPPAFITSHKMFQEKLLSFLVIMSQQFFSLHSTRIYLFSRVNIFGTQRAQIFR